MENKTFPQGLIAKEGNVDFVKARLSFKVEEFVKCLKDNEKNGWVNIDIKESKSGKLYADFNTFEPKKQDSNQNEEDLPF